MNKNICDPPEHVEKWITASNDSILVYQIKPNFEQVYDGYRCRIKPTHIKINSFGFRDYEYSIKKPNNTIRIIAIGDSFTFGLGVELEDSWPKQLEKILNENNKNKNIHYQVLNLGVPGYNFEQYFENIRVNALKLQPDIIIIAFIRNDAYPPDSETQLQEFMKTNCSEIRNFSNKDSGEFHRAMEKCEAEFYSKFSKDFEEHPLKYWQALEGEFTNISNITRENNIRIIITNLNSVPQPFIKEIINFSNNQSWCYVDGNTQKTMEEANRNTLNLYDGHPNKLGHELIAEKIFRGMIKYGLINETS